MKEICTQLANLSSQPHLPRTDGRLSVTSSRRRSTQNVIRNLKCKSQARRNAFSTKSLEIELIRKKFVLRLHHSFVINGFLIGNFLSDNFPILLIVLALFRNQAISVAAFYPQNGVHLCLSPPHRKNAQTFLFISCPLNLFSTRYKWFSWWLWRRCVCLFPQNVFLKTRTD